MEMIYRLEDKANRPIIKLDKLFPGCTALLDTGAIIPVWTKDVKLLQGLGAHFYKQNVEFAGFGGKTKGDLYKITLYLDKIIFPDLPIIVHNNVTSLVTPIIKYLIITDFRGYQVFWVSGEFIGNGVQKKGARLQSIPEK